MHKLKMGLVCVSKKKKKDLYKKQSLFKKNIMIKYVLIFKKKKKEQVHLASIKNLNKNFLELLSNTPVS